MEGVNDSIYETGIIDIKLLVKKLFRNWKLIAKITAFGFALGAILSLGEPRKYTVVSNIAPELSLRTNSLTSIAQIAGISNLLSNNNDALLPSVYPYIVSSEQFLADLCSMKVNDSTLYYYLLNDTKKGWIGSVVSLPFLAVNGIKSLFSEKDDTSVIDIDPFHPTKEQAAVFRMIRKMILVDVDKKTFLVSISVTAQDPVVAADLSNLIIKNLKRTVIMYRTSKTADNVEYLERVYNDARKEYYDAQSEYARYLDRNQGISSKSSQVKELALKNEVDLKFRIYSSLASELQQEKTKLKQETPVFAEITPPSVPVKSSNSRKSYTLAITFLVFVCACVYVLIKKK